MAKKRAKRQSKGKPAKPSNRRPEKKEAKKKVGKASEPPGAPEGDEGIGELLDMDQAIEMLRTTRSTFYRWLRSGKVKGMKVGRQWRFRKSDLERFLKGEAPAIELRADIAPLIRLLERKLKDLGGSRPVPEDEDKTVRAVALMIALAYRMRASDIHIAPQIDESGRDSEAVLRYRVDGVLMPVARFDIRLLGPVAERWRTMANVDTHERMKPQDGRILVEIEGKPLDLRVSFIGAALGESITARLLSADAVRLNLDDIEYSPDDRGKLESALLAPSGMIVFTGPTGSGKTTAMYASVNFVARPELKTISIEDPVEYFLPWVVQVGIHGGKSITFASAMRSALRSDPDVIMIGEIRDRESMSISQQAALTGHLLITALHTENAAGALVRMVEIGTDPFVVAESSRLIVAQRLVRRLCPECSREESPPDNLMREAEDMAREGGIPLQALPRNFRSPQGCTKCGKTGFRGRNVIAEMLEVTPAIGRALRKGATTEELQAIAVKEGMTTMGADGVRRAAGGETTLQDVIRVMGLR